VTREKPNPRQLKPMDYNAGADIYLLVAVVMRILSSAETAAKGLVWVKHVDICTGQLRSGQ
jgi:hypothetical protein